jgi:translocation and assembly module TamB
MSRRRKIVTIVAASFAGLILILFIAAIAIMQTDWFRGWVRDKIIAVTEESTGGRVELGRFNFEVWGLRATIEDFVLHGTEPPEAAPLFRARKLEVQLKLFSGLRQVIDLRGLYVDDPQANVIVYADGRTNVPEPKVKKESDKSALETIVELKVGRFELRNGLLQFADQSLPLVARGENLRAVLNYNLVRQGYEGEIAMAPLYVTYANNERANLNVTVPVTLERDRIGFENARIATAESEVLLSGAVENLVSPRVNLRANAKVALAEVQRVAGVDISGGAGKTLPGIVTAEVNARMGDNRIEIEGLRAALGNSTVEASGTLKDPEGRGSLEFKSQLALNELGSLFNVEAQPRGTVTANGNVALVGDSGYRVTGNINGRDLSFQQGGRRYSNIHIASAVDATQEKVALQGLRLDAFGGNFTGDAALENMERFQLNGQLRSFNLDTLARVFTGKPLGYGGVVSGPVTAQGNIKAPGTTGIQANANLAISPGRGGVPVSGRINARYNGANDTIQIADSFISLPNSRLSLSGDLGRQLNVQFRSTDLNDFLPAMQATSDEPAKLPVALNRGEATFNGTIRGTLASPRVQGQLAVSNFEVEGRRFDSLRADVSASASGAKLENATLARGNMRIDTSAAIELRDWKVQPQQKVALNTTIRDGDVADLLALAGQPDIPITGTVNGDIQLTGTVGNPAGTAQVVITNGVAYEQPFQRAEANLGFTNQRVTLSPANVIMDAGRVDITGSFEHPADDWSTGTIQAHVRTSEVQLALLRPVVKQIPGLSGTLQADTRVAGNLGKQNGETQFLLSAVNGDINARSLQAEGEQYGNLTATARTAGSVVEYRVDSDFAGSTLRVNGNTALQPGYPTTAKADMQNLRIERVLRLARRQDIPVRGTVSGTAQFTGTADQPNGAVDIAVTNPVVYGEPLDRVELRGAYKGNVLDVPRFLIAAGPGRIEGTAHYTHAPGDMQTGDAVFRVTSTDIQLAKLEIVQRYRPGLGGVVRIQADGAATVRKGDADVSALNADIGATGLVVNGRPAGDLRLVAKTEGDRLDFNLNSNLAGSQIVGKGQATLRADYPLTAQIRFSNVTYSGLQPLIQEQTIAQPLFDVFAEGDITLSGPVRKPEAMSGKVSLGRLEVVAKTTPAAGSQPVAIRNDGPIVFALDKSTLKVQQARMVGPQTEIVLAGTAQATGTQALDLNVKANTNLGLLQEMSRSIYSSGAIALQAAVRGTMTKPLVNGRLDLKDASFNYIELPNGISNANGVIIFSGDSATIQNLTAESGGGKLRAGGFVRYGSTALAYSLRASADGVRVRQPPGASIVATAQVNLTGTSDRSLLAGTVTLDRIAFSPRSDAGGLLARTSQPAEVPEAPIGPVAGMRLDIAVRTSPNVAFETSLAQDIQADVDLRVRGTLASPGVVGRITITHGEMVFFGTKYTVSQGAISFYDPNRINPILNIDLQTNAKGVNVVLNVSGPIDNMKLTHRSDPPLQFNEIIALLATGRTPTSDPNLVAKEPATPPQSLQQMGQSALISQAIANPVASRLERVFGVSQLKIDPTFTSGSELPQARMTLQQQISSDITFTYITNLNQTNAQIIRVEWALNPEWLAVATREETGRFGVDFFYRRSFR